MGETLRQKFHGKEGADRFALAPAAKREEPTVFAHTHLKTFKRKINDVELNEKQVQGIASLKKRRAHLHEEERIRVHDGENPYVAEHQQRCSEAQSDCAKAQAKREAAKVSAEKEKYVFRMNSQHNGADKVVRGITDRMPLHYKVVTSIWDADIILVNDLAVVDSWAMEGKSKLLPKTVMCGMALGCRFAVERDLKEQRSLSA